MPQLPADITGTTPAAAASISAACTELSMPEVARDLRLCTAGQVSPFVRVCDHQLSGSIGALAVRWPAHIQPEDRRQATLLLTC